MISGLISGTLAYDLKREFLSNSFALRDVTTLQYEIYSVDLNDTGSSALVIQNQIQNQFSQQYSGDIRVTVFNTQNTFAWPSDSLRASKYNVTVEIKSPVANLGSQFPELSGSYYSGLDVPFWNNYGQYLLGFKEDFGFSTNNDGNREFNHTVSFGLQTGISGSNTPTGRKSIAQTIVSYIFSGDDSLSFGLDTMLGEISSLANTGIFRNYYTESYDLMKNTYSFERKRTELPFSDTNIVFNLSNSINMNQDGFTEVTEKADTIGKINFSLAQSNLDSYLANSYTRCTNIYNAFYNSNVIGQDAQYDGVTFNLPLINTPVKTIKTYNEQSLSAGYEVSYTNNPTFSGDGTITSQNFEFNIDTYNRVEAIHSYDYTVNRILNNSGYFTGLLNNTTGISPLEASGYYYNNFPTISAIYPNLNLIKEEIQWGNIKPKGSAKFYYSNSPLYFVNINGITFNILDTTIENKTPQKMVNESKVIQGPNNLSVLSYEYQSSKGEITITIKAGLGKSTNQFYPDGMGQFSNLGGGNTLSEYLNAIYQYAGSIFLSQFNTPLVAFNWCISDSKYSLDSDGNLSVVIDYSYTQKLMLPQNYP